MTLQEIILTLQNYWSSRGCVVVQPWDVEKGAGTFNAATYLRALGPEPWNVAYVEPSRRPADGRYGENPNRLERHHQFQVLMKPSPKDIQEMYLGSLRALGIDPLTHDLRFVEDNWESPTLGAWGLGWEVWCDGMEVTQFTYFQQCGGFDLQPIAVELTYGLERLAMALQNVENVYALRWNQQFSYGDIRHIDEVQWSKHNFEHASIELHLRWFTEFQSECQRLCEAGLAIPAYDYCLRASHTFNILDARGAIGVTERQAYILRVRDLAKRCAEAWMALRESMGFPLVARQNAEEPQLPALPAFELRTSAATGPFLLEVGCEEIPARLAPGAAQQLRELVAAELSAAGLPALDWVADCTPRRLVLSTDNLPVRLADRVDVVKGPPVQVAFDAEGKRSRAGDAFYAKLQPDDEVGREGDGKGNTILVARRQVAGRPTAELLAEVLPRVLAKLHWPKSMRWGAEKQAFVRPVQWLLCALDGALVPFDFAGVRSGLLSRGHRFHAPETFEATTLAGLEASLSQRHVLLRADMRRAHIVSEVARLAAELGGRPVLEPSLLEEVVHLAEWPVGILGRFEPELLELPRQAVVTPMRVHQRYVPIEGADGRLLPGFVAIAGTVPRDPAVVAHGMARVLRARLADARFFFEADLARPLDAYLPQLETRIWLQKLGSVRQKVDRIAALVARMGGDDHALQAARLSKADLATAMVGEFPELQGEMGRVYARRHGLPEPVAEALYEHYLPRGADDELPQSLAGTLVGLADRLDSIVGCFGIGLLPTGSKDPYALRRQAIAVINVLARSSAEFERDLVPWVERAIEGYNGALDGKTAELVLEFFAERTRFLFRERLAADVVDAVVGAGASRPAHVVAKVEALAALRDRGELEPLLGAFRRVANIVKAETLANAPLPEGAPQERALSRAYADKALEVSRLSAAGDFAGVARHMAELRPLVDAFFDHVMVMADDPALRAQRVGLLVRLRDLFTGLADFTRIQERKKA